MFCYTVFIMGTMLSLAMSGIWFGENEINMINTLTGYNIIQIQTLSFGSVIGMVSGFFTNGLPMMLSWGYPYLDNFVGNVIKLAFLYPVTFGVVWGVIELFVQVLQGLASAIAKII
jgi:hypothetical protein